MIIQGDKAIERISVGGNGAPIHFPKRKSAITLTGSPIASMLNELFFGKIIKKTRAFWRLRHLKKNKLTPREFSSLLIDCDDLFMNKISELESMGGHSSECMDLESSREVLYKMAQDYNTLHQKRSSLLKS